MKNTPHINPTAPIVETILLPGDPLRAKFIADNFLTDAVQFNAVRNVLGFTGKYNGKKFLLWQPEWVTLASVSIPMN